MNAQLHIGRASALPLDLIAQAIPRLSRHDLEVLTERLIEHLDTDDGDADEEDDDSEDSFAPSDAAMDRASGPGCQISDPDTAVEDQPHDPEEDMCLAGDDGCGPVVIHGRIHWGSTDEAQGT